MKYNKSEIMRDAWNRFKSAPKGSTYFGHCLHLAWEAAKTPKLDIKLPAMTGTEKQLVWAEKIRAAQVAWVAQQVQRFEKRLARAVEQDNTVRIERNTRKITEYKNGIKWLVSHATRAGWWLDNTPVGSLKYETLSNFSDWDYMLYCLKEDPEMKNLRFRPSWLSRMA